VQPLSIIKNLDVFGDGKPGPGSRCKSPTMIHLILQGGEERLSGGVVPADSRSTDAGQQAFFGAESVEFGRGVLATSDALLCVK
jgi:hypothetical protein